MLEENVKPGAVNESTHNNVRDAGPNDTEQLMVGIRDRFTRFVLRRVDQQIAMLENSNISSSNGNLCFPTSTQILCHPNANMQSAYIHSSLVHNQPQDLNNSSEPHSFTPTNLTNNVIQGPFAFIPPPYPSLNANSNLGNSNVQLNQSKRPHTQVNIPSSTEKSGNHYKQSTDTANCIYYGERIQTVELNVLPQPLVLVSVYMPCNGGRSNSTAKFLDCLDQLHALYTRYSATHSILIGGDMNENIMVASDTQRNRAFRKFLQDNSLEYSTLGKLLLTQQV